MASHYLIDYENVREAGVNYCHHAAEDDIVYLIYTSNASKIGLDALSGMNASVKVIKVAAGKQSLDMHLISILGYLIHKHGPEDKYMVISKDTGYDSVLKYWNAQGYKTTRIAGSDAADDADDGADAAVQEQETQKTGTAQAGQNASSSRSSRSRRSRRSRSQAKRRQSESEQTSEQMTEQAPEPVQAPEQTQEQTQEQMQENVTDQAPEQVPVQAPAQMPEQAQEQAQEQEPVQAHAPGARKKKRQVEAAPAAAEPETSGEIRKRLNGRILSTLSKEKVDIKTAGQIASIVVKNVGDKNAKRTIYRSILQKFGQKQGLAYYTLIKKEL